MLPDRALESCGPGGENRSFRAIISRIFLSSGFISLKKEIHRGDSFGLPDLYPGASAAKERASRENYFMGTYFIFYQQYDEASVTTLGLDGAPFQYAIRERYSHKMSMSVKPVDYLVERAHTRCGGAYASRDRLDPQRER